MYVHPNSRQIWKKETEANPQQSLSADRSWFLGRLKKMSMTSKDANVKKSERVLYNCGVHTPQTNSYYALIALCTYTRRTRITRREQKGKEDVFLASFTLKTRIFHNKEHVVIVQQ